uniref:Uncharacterized protein n=1 Tax=Paramormyrops kingsleyae TaxID=1676925 RepID=A0A3B3T5B5_9TELE
MALAVVDPEWILLATVSEAQPVCEYQPLDFVLACSYMRVLLLAALVAGPNGCSSVPLWATWMTFHLYGNAALGLSSTCDDRVQAAVLVAQAWLLQLLHANPESHATLRNKNLWGVQGQLAAPRAC